MKKLNKYTIPSLFMMLILWTACEDEVLVPVEDTSTANQILAEIDSVESSMRTTEDLIIEYNTEENAVRITNTELEAKRDSLYDVRDSLNSIDTYIDDPEITYTVSVNSAAHSISDNSRFSGYIDAQVTIYQGTKTVTASTSNGQAIFSDINDGAIDVRIEAEGWTTVTYKASIGNPTGAENYNASTSVTLYPLTQENGALHVSGMAYANVSTLNDTLDRVHPTTAGSLEGTFIAEPNNSPTSNNYTQNWDYENDESIYGDVNGYEVNYETLAEGTRVYAFPDINEWFGTSDSGSGDVYSITYFGLIQIAQVQSDGSYEMAIPIGYDNDYSIEIYIPENDLQNLEHERLIDESGDVDRSELVDFTYYNNSETDDFVYDGGTTGLDGDGTQETVGSGESLAIKRAKVTETWIYRAIYTDPGNSGNFEFDDLYIDSEARFSETSVNVNIYAFPYYFVSE